MIILDLFSLRFESRISITGSVPFVLEHVEDDSKEDKVNALMDMIAKIEHELKSIKSELANV